MRPSFGLKGNLKYINNSAQTVLIYLDEFVSNITGTLEEFVTYAQSKGKTTGSFGLRWASKYPNVTQLYNGVAKSLTELASLGLVPNKEESIFSWDAQGNITWNS